jgi:hypothetical protein
MSLRATFFPGFSQAFGQILTIDRIVENVISMSEPEFSWALRENPWLEPAGQEEGFNPMF